VLLQSDEGAAATATVPLLQHRLEVDQMTLVRPDVLLETDAAGRNNWRFSREAVPPANAVANAPAPVTPPARPEDIAARRRSWWNPARKEVGRSVTAPG